LISFYKFNIYLPAKFMGIGSIDKSTYVFLFFLLFYSRIRG